MKIEVLRLEPIAPFFGCPPRKHHMISYSVEVWVGPFSVESSSVGFLVLATARYLQRRQTLYPSKSHKRQFSEPLPFPPIYNYSFDIKQPCQAILGSLRECDVEGRDKGLCKPEREYQFGTSHQKLEWN